MNQRTTVDGIVITRPTRDDIYNLQVGDLAPDCFGNMRKVVEIYALDRDIHGKAFVCYYVEFGRYSHISHSMKEGEAVPTIPAGNKYKRIENYPNW